MSKITFLDWLHKSLREIFCCAIVISVGMLLTDRNPYRDWISILVIIVVSLGIAVCVWAIGHLLLFVIKNRPKVSPQKP